MPREVRITSRAENDIDEALAWLVERSPLGAAQWHARLLEKIETLEDQPKRCPVAAEADAIGVDVRELLFGKRRHIYRILFTVSGDAVNVLHVRHAARDWLRPEDISGE